MLAQVEYDVGKAQLRELSGQFNRQKMRTIC